MSNALGGNRHTRQSRAARDSLRLSVRTPLSDVELLGELVQHRQPSHCRRGEEGGAVPVGEHFPAAYARPRVEAAVRAVRAGHRLEQVCRRVGRLLLVRELAGVAGLGEIAIDQAGAMRLARIALTVGNPTQMSRRLWVAAK